MRSNVTSYNVTDNMFTPYGYDTDNVFTLYVVSDMVRWL